MPLTAKGGRAAAFMYKHRKNNSFFDALFYTTKRTEHEISIILKDLWCFCQIYFIDTKRVVYIILNYR